MINRDDINFRRGTVLGLTMAEAVILIVFSLLLLLNHLLTKKDEKFKKLEVAHAKLEQILKENANHEALVDNIGKIFDTLNVNNFDDAFKELELVKQKIATLEKQTVALKEKNKELEAIKNVLDNIDGISPESLKNSLVIIEKFVSASKDKLSEKELNNFSDIIERLEREKSTMQGQLSYMQKKLDNGKGTEKPACWANKDGRPEYIYSVAMASDGLTLHKIEAPDRDKDYAELPVSSVIFEKKIGLNDFRIETNPLYQWSNEHNCRFFVKVFDLTAGNEKEIYKKHLRIVGEHFYYYEPVDEKYQYQISSN